MKCSKKKISILLLLIMIISFITINVNADSGFDGSYGGGSSSSSSFSSSSYGSSHNSSNDGEVSSEGILLAFLYYGGMVIFIIIFNNTGNKCSTKLDENDMNKDRFNENTGMDIEEFKAKAFDIYKNIQIAWMNFDYKELEKYLTNDMYNMYKSQLEVLNLKHQKNMMENIQYLDSKIINTYVNDDTININMILQVSCNDYIINDKNKVVNGNKNTKVMYKYSLTFVMKNNVSNTIICPSCGATLDNKATNNCPYCNATIISDNYNIILSKKSMISQNRM